MQGAKPGSCELCGREAVLRRGMCPACYQRWRRGTVPTAARCAACGCSDPRVLCAVALGDESRVTICYNCAHLVGRAAPRPANVAALRELATVPGERRRGVDRRSADRRESSVSFGEWDRRNSPRRRADSRPLPQ